MIRLSAPSKEENFSRKNLKLLLERSFQSLPERRLMLRVLWTSWSRRSQSRFLMRLKLFRKGTSIYDYHGIKKFERFYLYFEEKNTSTFEKTLKNLDYKIGILTNNWKNEDGQSFIMKEDLFDVVVESAKLGTRKPNRDIYEKVISEMDMAPEDLVFLDDIGKNLKAAKALGIQTIKVETGKPQRAIHELSEIIGKELVGWPSTTTPLRAGLELDEQKLRKLLKEKLDLEAEDLILRQFDHGQSNPTYYIKYAGEELVLRKKPPGKLILP